MDSLRLALLIIGILIVIGIYGWNIFISERRERSSTAASPSRHRQSPGLADSSYSDGLYGDDVIADAVRNEPVVLFVRAASDRVFSSLDIFAAAAAADMQLGRKHVFQHISKQGSAEPEQPQFIMADMYAPGTFPGQASEKFQTSGLALILHPPLPDSQEVPPGVIFDHFLASARLITEHLDGMIFFDRNTPLTADHLASLRARYVDLSEVPSSAQIP